VNDNRRQVLEMLASRQITTDEADRLLAALKDLPRAPTSGDSSQSHETARPKYLRVIIDSNEPGEGPVKINVRVPLMLLRAGVRLASLIPPQAQERVNLALRERGLTFDLSQIKPENINELIDQLSDLSVDIDQKQDDVKIRIFCE
jgi:hypothetical protein